LGSEDGNVMRKCAVEVCIGGNKWSIWAEFFFIFGSLRHDEIFVMLVVPLLDGEF
jgi:hypothetical protein